MPEAQLAPDTPPNVLILSPLPWYVSEGRVRELLREAYAESAAVTTRLYTNPVNGASRGICYVEYPPGTDLAAVRERVELHAFERHVLTVQLYRLEGAAQRWDREGNLPELPTDPPRLAVVPALAVGYGGRGYSVCFGEALGVPNTATPHGAAKLKALRKRLRAHRSPTPTE